MNVDGSCKWCRSFAGEECEYFSDIDKDNGCRKQACRVLKHIRNKDPQLKWLLSYHVKSVLMLCIKENPYLSWEHGELGERVIQLLLRLEICFKERYLKHPYLEEYNVLEHIKEKRLDIIQKRLHKIVTSETELLKIINR